MCQLRRIHGLKFVLELFKDVFKRQCIVEGLDAILLSDLHEGEPLTDGMHNDTLLHLVQTVPRLRFDERVDEVREDFELEW